MIMSRKVGRKIFQAKRDFVNVCWVSLGNYFNRLKVKQIHSSTRDDQAFVISVVFSLLVIMARFPIGPRRCRLEVSCIYSTSWHQRETLRYLTYIKYGVIMDPIFFAAARSLHFKSRLLRSLSAHGTNSDRVVNTFNVVVVVGDWNGISFSVYFWI